MSEAPAPTSGDGSPTVSVILPTYQRRELVRRAVASVLAQTYRDFELIVVDDGSTDGTREALAGVDDRLRYEWQENRGVAAARNVGLRVAGGSIVAFLDSDNLWMPEHLRVVTELLARHPEAVAASTCPGYLVRGRESLSDAQLIEHGGELSSAPGRIGFLSCAAARRKAVSKAGGFDERMKAFEDSDLIRKLATLGPFCTVRRQTIKRQYTSGGLRDRARRSGDYLVAAELTAENLFEPVERMPEPDRSVARFEASGLWHVAKAMRALNRGDEAAFEIELAESWQRLPLYDMPMTVKTRLSDAPEFAKPHQRLRMLRTFVDHCPDPHSVTGHFIRAWAIGLAIKSRRLREVAALLSGWRVRGMPRFVWRMTPVLYRLSQRAIQDRRSRVGEMPAVNPTPSDSPTVSVIIPTYQRRELVKRAVDSVIAQTYRDFELIVVDDGSTDGTDKALEGIDERIRYQWQETRGVSAARNAGLRVARGSIVAFLDSDNMWMPQHLECIVDALDRYPEAELAFSIWQPEDPRRHHSTPIAEDHLPRLFARNSIGRLSAIALRRDAAFAVGGFDERLAIAEDADLFLRVALRGGTFAVVPQRTTIKEVQDDSLFGKRAAGEYADALALSTTRIISELEARPGEPAQTHLTWARGRQHMIEALRGLQEGEEERVRIALKEACRILPSLSRHEAAILNHIEFNLHRGRERSELERQLALAAACWPDPDSGTARALRAHADGEPIVLLTAGKRSTA